MESDTGCSVEWNPVNSYRIISARNDDPFSGENGDGQYDWEYRELDARRWADFYGVPFIEPRGRVEFDSDLIALAGVAAKSLGVVREFTHELYKAMFVDIEVTRIDRKECISRANKCGLSSSEFCSALDSDTINKKLSMVQDKCLAIGLLGYLESLHLL
ncbi:MAG: hypothetical protein KUG73_06675 [Pseudomonadales bacterium]|nr:hypothetical protein [Pseudomonadales bacterium]